MRLGRLIYREIRRRKLSFALAAMSAAVAVAFVTAQVMLLAADDIRTAELLDAEQQAVEGRLTELTEAYRKLTLRIGFNVRILPKGQNLDDFFASGFAAKTMDEAFAHRLAESKSLTTIRHLLPKLERRISWGGRPVVLLGTRGELPALWRDDRKTPIITRIPPGRVDVGGRVGVAAGETIRLGGREFTVRRSYPVKDTRADITIWMDLPAAQELLDAPGEITEIQAVDCRCAWADIDAVRAELERILPETQVVLTRDTALVRAEARVAAEAERKAAIEQQRRQRGRLKAKRAAFAARTAPLVVIGCALWVGLLAFANARDRAVEIGVLRAIGVRTGQILRLLFARAILTGLVGAVVGFAGGFAAAVAAAVTDAPRAALAGRLFDPWLAATLMALTPLVAMAASWAPAAAAAKRDPAAVLSRE